MSAFIELERKNPSQSENIVCICCDDAFASFVTLILSIGEAALFSDVLSIIGSLRAFLLADPLFKEETDEARISEQFL